MDPSEPVAVNSEGQFATEDSVFGVSQNFGRVQYWPENGSLQE